MTLWLLAPATACISCGGAGSSAAEACGGDPTGEWNIASLSIDYSGVDPSANACGMQVNVAEVTASGTFHIQADRTYQSDALLGGLMKTRLPPKCLVGAGRCSDLSVKDTTCTGDVTNACECTSTLHESSKQVGTWSASGTTLTLTHGGKSETADYCVNGNQLTVRESADPGKDIPSSVMTLQRK